MDLAWLGGTFGGGPMTGEILGISFGVGTCESSDTSGLEVGSLGDVETSFVPDGDAAGIIIRYG